MVPGLGRTSVWGGKYDATSGEGKSRELRTLFRIFLEEKLSQKKTVRLLGICHWVVACHRLHRRTHATSRTGGHMLPETPGHCMHVCSPLRVATKI